MFQALGDGEDVQQGGMKSGWRVEGLFRIR